ncbi:MAG: GGDEF domain-containing protein [Lachnospiraceae bacterium]|nr:GGDEF domain-containing protein [Lachnospiraceae bacterium]
MSDKTLENYTPEDIIETIRDNVDAVIIIDYSINQYRALVRRNVFAECIDETGDYDDLMHKLWFHKSDSNEKINSEYDVYISYFGEYKGKNSRKIKVFPKGSDTPKIVQMTVYPIKGTTKCVFIMDELDDDSVQDQMTYGKVNTIQNSFLFSMYVDLILDTTSSISVTEISEEVVNADIKYSDWRLMTVNMIWPEGKDQFLKTTDPEYLKENLAPGHTISFDCQMQNLEGQFIWVKLIFSRAETNNNNDFRFVFMVQNIHETYMELTSTLKKYEELALNDPLTELLNHGSIKSAIKSGIENVHNTGNDVSIMMIDLDYFKEVNDTYGHSVGDDVLKSFAGILKDTLSNTDCSIGRWGGEEFVIVCNNICGRKLDMIAEDLRKKVEETEFPKAGHLTCSVGVTQIKESDTFDDAFNRMDKAMYQSKKNGRNCITRL